MNPTNKYQQETRLIQDIPLHLIDSSSLQMRRQMDPAALEQLTESLKRDGQQRPIKVRPSPTAQGHYEIVFGHRTVSALKRAGYKTAQAIVEDLSDEDVMYAQHSENCFREGICDYDLARWYREMIDKYGYTQTKLAERINVSQSSIANHIRMLKLDGVISREILLQLSEFQSRAILSAPNSDWGDICNVVKEHYETEGELPSAHKISDYIEHLEAIRFLQGDVKPEFVEGLNSDEVALPEFQDDETYKELIEGFDTESQAGVDQTSHIQELRARELILEILHNELIKCPYCGKGDLGWLCLGKPLIIEQKEGEGG